MPTEQQTSTSAKILYRPLGLASSIVGGIVAGQVFKQVWKRAAPGEQSDPPRALESEYRMREVLIAAAVQGAIFALVKASHRPRWRPCLRALDGRVAG